MEGVVGEKLHNDRVTEYGAGGQCDSESSGKSFGNRELVESGDEAIVIEVSPTLKLLR